MNVLIDIESRSRADLPEVGAYRYGCDPSTTVMMMAVTEETKYSPVHLWVNPMFEGVGGVCSDPLAVELLRREGKVFAHNATFELAVLDGTGWSPFIAKDRWRCTAAMARVIGFPESLDKCAKAMELKVEKDPRGKALIQKFSVPKKDGTFNDPKDFPDDWRDFCNYCRKDVEVERDILIWCKSYGIFQLIDWDTWDFTVRMNDVGIPVNVSALQNAQRILDEQTTKSREEFRQLTGVNITQREAVRQWLNAHGVPLDNMRGETLLQLPKESFSPDVDRVVELYQQMSFAAVKKVKVMLDWVMPDGRMRGVFKFNGAGTGRWSAGGPQMHNAKKPTAAMRPVVKDAYRAICDGVSAPELDAVYGNPVEVISSCVRHFVHDPASLMFDADYNAIEARIAVWLSNDEEAMDEYRRGMDRYVLMAARIYSKSPVAVTPDERDLGKLAILGLIYGMGAPKFQESCELKGKSITVELAARAKDAFRNRHQRMVKLWRTLETCARKAVNSPGLWVTASVFPSIRFHMDGRFLKMFLPSGRPLWYYSPRIQGSQLCYIGQLPMSTQWGTIQLYGAKLFENCGQAVAADIMSYGARQAETSWMSPFALIHDQALAMPIPGTTPEMFSLALTQLPPWARGLPIKADAKLVEYYTK